MRRIWIPLVILSGFFLFGCRYFFVTAPESTNPSKDIEITIDLMPDINVVNAAYRPVVCLGKPASWTISEVSYDGYTNSTVRAFGYPTYSPDYSTYMDSNHSIQYPADAGDWSCYLGPDTTWTSDAYGSVTFNAVTGPAGAFTIYISAGENGSYGPDWSMIEKRVAVGSELPDAEHWVKAHVDAILDFYLYGVAQGGGNYVAVGRKKLSSSPTGLTSVILHSTDGKHWSEIQDTGNPWLQKVHYADGRFVAVGETGVALTSATGESWEEVTPAESRWWPTDVTYGNATWVAITTQHALWATDINSWSSTRVPDSFDLHGITFGQDHFVAVGGWTEANAKIFTSPNGQDWTMVESSTTGTLEDVAYGNGRFVAVGHENIYYSDNLSEWNIIPNPAAGRLLGVEFNNGVFVAVGAEGSMLTSPDGAAWTEITSGTSLWLEDVNIAGGGFIAVGHYGLIILSDDPSVGGGGGCNTLPASNAPLWPELIIIAFALGGIFWRRKKVKG